MNELYLILGVAVGGGGSYFLERSPPTEIRSGASSGLALAGTGR